MKEEKQIAIPLNMWLSIEEIAQRKQLDPNEFFVSVLNESLIPFQIIECSTCGDTGEAKDTQICDFCENRVCCGYISGGVVWDDKEDVVCYSCLCDPNTWDDPDDACEDPSSIECGGLVGSIIEGDYALEVTVNVPPKNKLK